jgi:hypothetical protein
MGVIAAEELNLAIDDMVWAYVKALGTAGSGYGIGQPEGAYGSGKYLQDGYSRLGNSTNPDPIIDFGKAWRSFRDSVDPETIFGEKARALVAAMDRHARRFGGANYSTLETLLRYFNTGAGGTWTMLQDRRWRDIFNAVKGGSNYPEEYNLFFEVLQGSTYANAVRKLVVGTGETAGQTIDHTLSAGGIPALNVSSFAGSSDTVTITGTFYDPATKAIETAKTVTFTVGNNGRFYRVGGTAAANALLISLTAIAAGANITAGTTIYAEAERPALRSGTVGATVTNTTVELDAGASAVNDFYNGLTIGTNADRYTWRTISDYDGNTKIATVSVAWATNPTGSTSLFRIRRPEIS